MLIRSRIFALLPPRACAVALGVACMASAALAQLADDNALVVIRFNQARVYYDQQLYSAVSRAVAVKPAVTFEVVSYAPATGNAQMDAQWQQAASQHTQSVVSTMQNIGVPLSRMQITGQRIEGLKFDEVHIIPH